MAGKLDAFFRQYEDSLNALRGNNKPQIDSLSMIAGECQEHAEGITGLIVKRIMSEAANRRMPVVYLMDCILKLVKGPYIQLFSTHAHRIMSNTFENGSESTRKSLLKLLRTWEKARFWGPEILEPIRTDVDSLARTTPPASSSSDYRKRGQTGSSRDSAPAPMKRPRYDDRPRYPEQRGGGGGTRDPYRRGPPDPYHDPRRRQPPRDPYYDDRRRGADPYYDAPRQPQHRVGDYPPAGGADPYRRQADPYRGNGDPYGAPRPAADSYSGYPPAPMAADPYAAAYARGQRRGGMGGTGGSFNRPEDIMSALDDVAARQQQQQQQQHQQVPVDPAKAAQRAQREQVFSALQKELVARPDLNPLLAELRRQIDCDGDIQPAVMRLTFALKQPPAAIAAATSSSSSSSIPSNHQLAADAGPRPARRRQPSFNPDFLRSRDPTSVWDLLHGGVASLRCAECGVRRATDEAMATHLDWHFKMNKRKREQEEKRLPRCRRWYLSDEDWAQVAEDELPDAREASADSFFAALGKSSGGGADGTQQQQQKAKSVPVDASQPECPVCNEEFEDKFWDDDEDCWMLTGTEVVAPDAQPGDNTPGHMTSADREQYAGKIVHSACARNVAEAHTATPATSADGAAGEGDKATANGVAVVKEEQVADEPPKLEPVGAS